MLSTGMLQPFQHLPDDNSLIEEKQKSFDDIIKKHK